LAVVYLLPQNKEERIAVVGWCLAATLALILLIVVVPLVVTFFLAILCIYTMRPFTFHHHTSTERLIIN
jgi:hypothetical protein